MLVSVCVSHAIPGSHQTYDAIGRNIVGQQKLDAKAPSRELDLVRSRPLTTKAETRLKWST